MSYGFFAGKPSVLNFQTITLLGLLWNSLPTEWFDRRSLQSARLTRDRVRVDSVRGDGADQTVAIRCHDADRIVTCLSVSSPPLASQDGSRHFYRVQRGKEVPASSPATLLVRVVPALLRYPKPRRRSSN